MSERRFAMALSGKYGKLDIPKIAAEEPVFILRAQDVLASTVIQMYQLLADSHGRLLAKDLDKEIQSFQKWSGSKKMPD
jgi:flavorubredoxin